MQMQEEVRAPLENPGEEFTEDHVVLAMRDFVELLLHNDNSNPICWNLGDWGAVPFEKMVRLTYSLHQEYLLRHVS